MRRVFRLPGSRARIAREIDDELTFHLDARARRLIAEGWSEEAARTEALRQFGDVASVRASMAALDQEREQATRRADLLADLLQDLSFAARALRRNLGVTSVIVGMLALGVGANTAIFTLVDAVLVRPLPVARPNELVTVGQQEYVTSTGVGTPSGELLSAPLYRDIRDGNQVFIDVLATGPSGRLDVRVSSGGELEHPKGRYVSGNFFSVLGVPAQRGRTLDVAMDATKGTSPVVVISDAYWTRRFQRDPSMIGRTVLINGVGMSVIGVTPPSFAGAVVGEATDVWLPLTMHDALEPRERILDRRSVNWLLAIGRLKPGATLEQAQQQIPSLIEASVLRNAPANVAKAFTSRPQRYVVVSGARGLSEVRVIFQAPLLTLMAGVALLLCIMCANVANLLLARAISRGREMAVRLALGANRARLVRQLMTESALLAIVSAGVGLVVAWWGSRALLTLASDGNAIPLDLGLDVPVLAFTLVVSVLAVGLFGLAPALRASRVDLAQTMRGGAGSPTPGRRVAMGPMLIAGQVALSIVLLTGATMLVRSLRNVQSAETGMDREHLVMAGVDVAVRGYEGARRENVIRAIRGRVAAIPGVASVSFSENGIFSGTDWHTEVQVAGFTPRTAEDSVVGTDQVGADYARTLGARIVAGRDMSSADEGRAPRVALVNQSLASFYFPGRSAVGQFLRFDDTVAVEIIGVMTDIRNNSLTRVPDRRVYFPYLHRGDTATIGDATSLRLIVRTIGDPSATVQRIREAILAVDPDVPIDGINPLMTLMRGTIREERLVARVASGFGVLAVLLAAIGLYGVMTYAITRRTGEIGLRVALGAQRDDVMRMVLFDALRLVGVGVVVGVPLALASSRLLEAQLHDVGSTDPASLLVAVGVLTTTAVIAASIPATRASKVSPMVALRSD